MRPTPLNQQTLDLIYTADAFTREDESDDSVFYRIDRFVDHLDTLALATVERLVGALIVEERPTILDLMASWDSHVPPRVQPARLVGLGLNAKELARNPALTERVIHDLNRDPHLPFPDATFDAVLNTVSVDYLTRPFDVFTEVGRVLRPGGLFLVVFSNRMFPPKAVKIWRESSEQERILLVEDFFQAAGIFAESQQWVSLGKPRPPADKYSALGTPSDPVYAVYAEKLGATTDRTPRVPPAVFETGASDDALDQVELAKRKAEVRNTLCCPYCGERLRKWAVPQTPFTEYDLEHLYVCFNDRCPFLVRGWDAMHRQGNLGFSHRFMYMRERNACGSLPVPSLRALRESIVDE